MNAEYREGWQMAVDWIYQESIKRKLTIGYNPMGREVSDKMIKLTGSRNNGFAEGLIWAIGTSVSEIKTRAIDRQ